MEKHYFLIVILCLSSQLNAQDWTKKDSIWLQKVLSGEERLQLNEETRKAIESGSLLAPDPYIQDQMKMKAAELPIIKSFEGITAPENKNRCVEPHELPVQVYKLYGLDAKDSVPDASRSTRLSSKFVLELKALDVLTPRKATVDDKATLRYGSVGGGVNAEDILRTIFWPSHRAKKRNRKNANAYKTYNNGY